MVKSCKIQVDAGVSSFISAISPIFVGPYEDVWVPHDPFKPHLIKSSLLVMFSSGRSIAMIAKGIAT